MYSFNNFTNTCKIEKTKKWLLQMMVLKLDIWAQQK